MPLISIIVPVYNVEKYLDKCLQSLSCQTFPDYEIICINDGSTDDSRTILTEWESKLPYMRVIDRGNGGLSAARNTGLEAATGKYVVFVDSDDWVEPTMLSRLANEVEGTDMVCFACRRTDNDTYDILKPEDNNGWDYFNQHALESRIVPFVCVWQRCYRREFLMANHLQFHEGILHEDNEFTPRACLKAKAVKVIPDVLYNYRVRPGSIMTTRGLKNKESLITIGNELSELFANESGINRTVVYRALTQYYQMAFTNNTKDEDRHLKQLIDWNCYRRVSRTKLRHYRNYLTMKISPILFRFINKMNI